MNIALCDEDERFLSDLAQKVKKFMRKKDMSCTIKTYLCGKDFLRCNIQQIDLAFLNIRMSDLDGIQVANILKQRNPDFTLVFVSSHVEYALLGYEAKALRYVLKEQVDALFDDVMEAVLKERGYFRRKLTFKFAFGTESFYTDTLIYAESKLHAVYLHFSADKIRYLYGTLDSVEKELPEEEFVRIHKSYLVNLKHFTEVKDQTALLATGVRLPISQRKYSKTKRKLSRYHELY